MSQLKVSQNSHLLLFSFDFLRLLEMYDHELIARNSMANFEVVVYGITIGEQELVSLMHQLVPLLPVARIRGYFSIWELIKLVLFGTCGVLDQDIKETSIIPPSCS